MKMLTKKIVDCIYVNKIIEQDMIAVCEYGVELVLAGIFWGLYQPKEPKKVEKDKK